MVAGPPKATSQKVKSFDKNHSLGWLASEGWPPYKLKHVCLSITFIEEATKKRLSKEHCMCIKQKQNISSQSFFAQPIDS